MRTTIVGEQGQRAREEKEHRVMETTTNLPAVLPTDAASARSAPLVPVPFRAKLHQIFIDILPFSEVTVDVVEVEAARESLVIRICLGHGTGEDAR